MGFDNLNGIQGDQKMVQWMVLLSLSFLKHGEIS
jgi:hypothetical protein